MSDIARGETNVYGNKTMVFEGINPSTIGNVHTMNSPGDNLPVPFYWNSDPGHSGRLSVCSFSEATSAPVLLTGTEKQLNDFRGTAEYKVGIVLNGYPDYNDSHNLQLDNRIEKPTQQLSAGGKSSRYIQDIPAEDSVSHSRMFDLRVFLREQQKLLMWLFGLVVLIIIAVILIVVLLIIKAE